MLRLYLNGTLFWSSKESGLSSDYAIFDLKLKDEVNSIGVMSFSITKLHPRYSEIHLRRSVFALIETKSIDDEENIYYSHNIEFLGKPSKIDTGMDLMVTIEVEDFMSILRDNSCNGTGYGDSTDRKYHMSPSILIQHIINALTPVPFSDGIDGGSVKYNYVDWNDGGWLKITRGTIEYPANKDGVEILITDTIETDDSKNLWDILFTDFIGNSQSIVSLSYRLETTSGDYYWEIGNSIPRAALKIYFSIISAQIDLNSSGHLYDVDNSRFVDGDENYVDLFEYGENLLSFDIEPAISNPVTGIKAIGTDSEGYYIDSIGIFWGDELTVKYGLVTETIDFGQGNYKYRNGSSSERDSALNELRNRVKVYASYRFKDYGDKVTVTGVSNYYISESNTNPIKISSTVAVRSIPHNLDFKSICLSKEIDYFHHENDRYIIGPYIPDNLFDYKISES